MALTLLEELKVVVVAVLLPKETLGGAATSAPTEVVGCVEAY